MSAVPASVTAVMGSANSAQAIVYVMSRPKLPSKSKVIELSPAGVNASAISMFIVHWQSLTHSAYAKS